MCCIYYTAICKQLPYGGSGSSGSRSFWFGFVFFTSQSSDFIVFEFRAFSAFTHRDDSGWNSASCKILCQFKRAIAIWKNGSTRYTWLIDPIETFVPAIFVLAPLLSDASFASTIIVNGVKRIMRSEVGSQV